ncbi:MAG TPA: 16S rRNA (cytosine(967)-C(5))-methyltransferase RsmB [Pyrinomonadaceae bacterium]|nr:16S rRNA (cytosine(967)-C(5))-methyltransferase RsmB [Pyrinomonadaceae bacterium]
MPVSPARRAAFDILRRVEEGNAYSSALLAAADVDLSAKDCGLSHEIVLGVLRRQLWLDLTIEHFAARRIEKLDLPVLLALRIGLYQLSFLSRIPPSAAVNESVNLVRAAKLKSAASFANGVLRQATREPEYDPAASVDHPVEKLSIETSHPRWLVDRWISQFGFAEASAIARANNNPPPITFRFTAKARSQHRQEEILDELRSAGAELRSSVIAQNGWRVVRSRSGEDHVDAGDDGGKAQPGMLALQLPARLRKLSNDGLIYFQDEGSQMVAQLVNAQTGDRVLDVCAAPGSKSTLVASLAPEATILAGDLYEHRARTIRQFANQQQAPNIQPIVYDATRELPFTGRLFDQVLVDAPCSGTGTLRHNPEIRWRLQSSDIAELSAKQKSILRNAAAMVRRGGVLIYSTCSLETEENEEVVADFCATHPDFEVLPMNVPATLLTRNGEVRTWPHRDDTDGFFVAGFQQKI